MIKKVELAAGGGHHEVFGNPAPLGLLGLAIACAALTPIAFGYGIKDGKIIQEAFYTSATYALLFGGVLQLLAGLMDFANRNTFGGTIFTCFAFNWAMTAGTFYAIAFGIHIDHTIILAVEILLLVVFLFLTYGFGFFSKLLFFFLLDIDLLYVARIARTITGRADLLNFPIAIFTVALGLIGLWLALGSLLNPTAGREIFPMPGPMFFAPRRAGFDWSRRRAIFQVLYNQWKKRAFEEMSLKELEEKVIPMAGQGNLLPELFYLEEYGALVLTLDPQDRSKIVSLRLNAQGIDLYEQLILKKYTF